MSDLRRLLAGEGFEDVRTYLQSGNVVLSSSAKPDEVARRCEQLIEEAFGLDIAVVTRTRPQLGQVVKRNPLGKVARNPKRYQVSFHATKAQAELVRRLESTVIAPERLAGRRPRCTRGAPEGRSTLQTLGLTRRATARRGLRQPGTGPRSRSCSN